MDSGLCEHPTRNGPCNMPKGHSAEFHRHRAYPNKMKWRISFGKTTVKEGTGRAELGYAITEAMKRYSNVVIEVIQ